MLEANYGMESYRFQVLLDRVRTLCKEVVAIHAEPVDTNARFPEESFAALKQEKLLSAYIPQRFGGYGLSIQQICKICETLARYCASTAMIYAMHQIQVACIVHHGRTPWFEQFMGKMAANQLLLASATTELGVGGDLRSSLCHVQVNGDEFTLEKQAPVVSYGEHADAILITCRKNVEAQAHEQLQVVAFANDCELEPISTWDTLGFRGTCSSGFAIKCRGNVEQILPVPFADILAQSMHPSAHCTWGSLWYGLAADAVTVARGAVRSAMRKNPDLPPVSSLRLAEADEQLFSMRGGLYLAIEEYQRLLVTGDTDAFTSYGFSVRTNNIKLRCSEMVVDIVGKAMMIVGIAGYKNDSPNSLCRHLRDAYGAALMVNNDRIRGHNASMQIALRGDA